MGKRAEGGSMPAGMTGQREGTNGGTGGRGEMGVKAGGGKKTIPLV